MINEEILEELKDFFAYYDDDIIIDNLEYFLYLGEDIVKIINNLKINNATLNSYSKVMNI